MTDIPKPPRKAARKVPSLELGPPIEDGLPHEDEYPASPPKISISPRKLKKDPCKATALNLGHPSSECATEGSSSSSSPKLPVSPLRKKQLEAKYKGLNYFDLVSAMHSQMPGKKNIYRLKIFPGTLVGNDIIKWLQFSNYATNTTEACFVGTELMVHGHIYNVLNEDEEEFLGGHQLYRFAQDDKVAFDVDSINLDQVQTLLETCLGRKPLEQVGALPDHAFCGHDAVNLIIDKGLVTSRLDAVKVLTKMVALDHLSTAAESNSKNRFQDDLKCFYTIRHYQEGTPSDELTEFELFETSPSLNDSVDDGDEDASVVDSLRNMFSSLAPRLSTSKNTYTSPVYAGPKSPSSAAPAQSSPTTASLWRQPAHASRMHPSQSQLCKDLDADANRGVTQESQSSQGSETAFRRMIRKSSSFTISVDSSKSRGGYREMIRTAAQS